ncbi:hypothetical protein Tco_0459524 [Tanacetum coccineum]
MERELGAGYSFVRKPCFVCGSLSHLIKDCDYYEKKIAREAALKSKRVIHVDARQARPAWTNTNRVNKANQFTPRPVQLSNISPNFSTASRTIKTGRVNVNTGKQNVSSGSKHVNSGSVHFNSGTQFKSGASRFNTGKQYVNSGRMYVNSGTQNKSGGSRVNTGKQNVNTARVNRPVLSNQTSKGKMGTAVKTSAGCVWRKTTPHSNTNSGPTPDSYVHVSQGPQGRPKPVKAWFTMSNQHKDWLVQEQTALGKDFSNPFYGAKGLTSPEQTATGKGISNPLMAVMVCQKPYGIQLTNVSRVNTPGSDENRLKLYDLMYKNVKVADTMVKD